MLLKSKSKIKVGPNHQGHKMSLRAFEFVEVEEGYLCELARGYVVVSEVPNYYHAAQLDLIQDFFRFYKVSHAGKIHMVLGGAECKLLMPDWESERHPDLAVYLTPPVGPKTRKMWRNWVPEIIVEVVSPRSGDRDYVEKREEYWTLGAKEYWIVDAAMGKVMQLRRGRTDWIERELFVNDFCETKLLPGFKMPCQAIFDAAGPGDDEED